jgi:hypothetical protein
MFLHDFRTMARQFAGITVAGLIWSLVAVATLAGNNGTLKVHERGTPFGTEDNDPKVCHFDVEAFNLDDGQRGFLTFIPQDDTSGSSVGPFAFGPADADGYAVSGQIPLGEGHFLAVLSKDGEAADVKAKSKVFKHTCDDSGGGGGQG